MQNPMMMGDYSQTQLIPPTQWVSSMHVGSLPGHGPPNLSSSLYDGHDRSLYTLHDRDMERLMFSPDQDIAWAYQSGESSEGTTPQKSSGSMEEVGKDSSNAKDARRPSRIVPKRTKGRRDGDTTGDYGSGDEMDHEASKERGGGKRRKSSAEKAQHDSGGSSIIKRRRKGELQIVVDGGLGLSVNAMPFAPSTTNNNNATKPSNLHSLSGGGIGDMGPPGETPRRSSRIKAGALSSLSNLNSLGFLESPFNQVMYPDMYSGAFGGDTPSRLMHLDPPLSKTLGPVTVGGEGVRFDFDEAVAAHFPSPRAGEQLKGSSPYRWSGGSVGSVNSGVFTFPDGSMPSKPIATGTAGTGAEADNGGGEVQQINIYAKKFKKAHKRDSKKGDSQRGFSDRSGNGDVNEKAKTHRVNFGSPVETNVEMNASVSR